MFAGVVPVQNSVGICEVVLMDRPAPVTTIGSEDFLLILAITTATRQPTQRRSECLKTVVLPSDYMLVPSLVVILPVVNAHGIGVLLGWDFRKTCLHEEGFFAETGDGAAEGLG